MCLQHGWQWDGPPRSHLRIYLLLSTLSALEAAKVHINRTSGYRIHSNLHSLLAAVKISPEFP